MTKRSFVASFITEDQEFQQLQANDARAAAMRAGDEIEVVFGEGQAVIQIKQLFQFIQAPEGERPDVILVEPIGKDGYERVARSAVSAGIGWVLINAHFDYIDELRGECGELPIFSVRTDQVEVGRIQAQQFRTLLPTGGSILYLQGPSSAKPAINRLAGMEEGIQGSGIEIQMIRGDWTEASGEKAVGNWMRLRSAMSLMPRIIGSQNDSMAVGARRALQDSFPGWKDMAYTGCDGLPDGGQLLVNSGDLTATVVTPSNGGTAVELAAKRLATGEPVPAEKLLAPKSYPAVGSLRPLPAVEPDAGT